MAIAPWGATREASSMKQMRKVFRLLAAVFEIRGPWRVSPCQRSLAWALAKASLVLELVSSAGLRRFRLLTFLRKVLGATLGALEQTLLDAGAA